MIKYFDSIMRRPNLGYKISDQEMKDMILYTSQGESVEVQDHLDKRDEKLIQYDFELVQRYRSIDPKYRQSLDFFRRFGLVLPLSCHYGHLFGVNQFIKHEVQGWVLPPLSNPLHGWPMKKLLNQNPYNLPENDLYGRLYFYLVDKLKILVALLKTNLLKFEFYNEGDEKLMRKMEKDGMCFDRIYCSTLSDEDQIGLKKCLKIAAPLLRTTNPCSRVITAFRNWLSEMEFGVVLDMKSELTKKQ